MNNVNSNESPNKMKIKVIKMKNKPSASDDKIKSPLTAFKNQEITQAKKNLKLV